MRGSLSNLKNNLTGQKDQRTTKTKASATKPNIFSISLARNKNNVNPMLFGSLKKSNKKQKYLKPFNYLLKQNNINVKPLKLFKCNVFQQLNNKISIDFINSLYTDLLIQMGHNLNSRIQNKQNTLMNLNLPQLKNIKSEQNILPLIKKIIELKEKVNQYYKQMENTRNIYMHVVQNKKQLLNQNEQEKLITQKMNQAVHQFLIYYQNQDIEINELQKQYLFVLNEKKKKSAILVRKHNQNYQQNDNFQNNEILLIKNQINKEKWITEKLLKQQKYLMGRLYNTQRKNNQLQTSCSTLQIKNLNLKQNLKFSQSLDLRKKIRPQNTLKRSLSVKLQKIRRYNINGEQIPIQQEDVKSMKSQTSSMNSGRQLAKLYTKHKETYFDRIH